jgi:hypothetical protein
MPNWYWKPLREWSVPNDLATRTVPAQTAGIDGAALLARAVVPMRRDRRCFGSGSGGCPNCGRGGRCRRWRFTFKEEKGGPVLRADYLLLNGVTYGLRSSPA